MGDYEDVLASLETLNHSVLKAMGYTKKVSRCGWPWGSELWFPMFSGASAPTGAWVCEDKCWVGLALGGLCLALLAGAEAHCEVSRAAP